MNALKIYSVIALTLGLFLISGSSIELKSQPCTTMVDTLTIDGCDYEVTLCVYCGLAYPGYLTVESMKLISSGCTTTLDPNELMQRAYTQVSTVSVMWYNYCQYHLPPCGGPEPPKEMTVRQYYCWKVKLDYYDAVDSTNYYLFLPCNTDDYCEVTYEYCVDSLGVVQKNLSSSRTDATSIDCTEEGEDIEIPEHPDPVGTESDCYILHTPCNPDIYIWD